MCPWTRPLQCLVPPRDLIQCGDWTYTLWSWGPPTVVLGPTLCGVSFDPPNVMSWPPAVVVGPTHCWAWTHPLWCLNPAIVLPVPIHCGARTHLLWCLNPPIVLPVPINCGAWTHPFCCLYPHCGTWTHLLWCLDPSIVVSLEKGHKCLILPSWNGNHCCGWKHLTRFVVIICCAIANFSRMWNALK